MLRLDFQSATGAVKSYVDAVNLYVTEQEPWVLAKDPADYETLQLRAVALAALHDAVRTGNAALDSANDAAAAVGPGPVLDSSGDQGHAVAGWFAGVAAQDPADLGCAIGFRGERGEGTELGEDRRRVDAARGDRRRADAG